MDEENHFPLPEVSTTLEIPTDLPPSIWLPGSGASAFESDLGAYPLGAQFDFGVSSEPSEVSACFYSPASPSL